MSEGVSRPNVNNLFPSRITAEVRGPFFGGGIQCRSNRSLLPLDVRMMLVVGKEANELVAVADPRRPRVALLVLVGAARPVGHPIAAIALIEALIP